MTFNTEEKLEEILGGLSSDTLDEIYDELHEVLCKSIIGLLQDSIAGPGISAEIVDIAPIVLTILGLTVPVYMDGRVLEELFHEKPEVNIQRIDCSRKDKSAISMDEDNKEIEKRLKDLGYL